MVGLNLWNHLEESNDATENERGKKLIASSASGKPVRTVRRQQSVISRSYSETETVCVSVGCYGLSLISAGLEEHAGGKEALGALVFPLFFLIVVYPGSRRSTERTMLVNYYTNPEGLFSFKMNNKVIISCLQFLPKVGSYLI